jgi:hypothetical protein
VPILAAARIAWVPFRALMVSRAGRGPNVLIVVAWPLLPLLSESVGERTLLSWLARSDTGRAMEEVSVGDIGAESEKTEEAVVKVGKKDTEEP